MKNSKKYNFLNKFAKECFEISKSKGFWETPNIGEKLALIHSEVSEALEVVRATGLNDLNSIKYMGNKPIGFTVELADIIIRVCDLVGFYELDLATAIELKMNYNKTRPIKHGKNF